MPSMLPVSFVAWLSTFFAAPVGDVVLAPGVADGRGLQVLPMTPASANPMVVFLDFEGPQIVQGEIDDSHTNTSFIGQAAVDYAPYGDAAQRAALVQAVQIDWSPFDVTLTETRPANGDYVMAVVSPTNPYAGQAAGIAPLDCNDAWTRNNVVFAFHGASDGYSINEQARTIGQEVAHSLGLEHTTDPNDIMSYAYGPADFWFVDDCMNILTTPQSPQIWCTGQHAEFCSAGQQNSHAELIELIGDAIPDTQSPVVAIVSPRDGAGFASGASFEILVDASDDVGIVEIELFANGESVAVDLAPPWSWSVTEIPEGDYDLHAEARDLAGNVAASGMVSIEVGMGGASGSDGADSAGSGAAPPTDSDGSDGSEGDTGGDSGSAADDDSAGGSDEAGDGVDANATEATYAHEIVDLGGCVLGRREDSRFVGLAALFLVFARRRRFRSAS